MFSVSIYASSILSHIRNLYDYQVLDFLGNSHLQHIDCITADNDMLQFCWFQI